MVRLWSNTHRVSPAGQQPLPVQPVEKPILCSPTPSRPSTGSTHRSGDATRMPGRRPASYWFKTQRVADSSSWRCLAEEQREDLPLVNALREDVKRWRESGYEGATQVTKELLRYWWRDDRPRRLFFCQLEAAETVIFLNEIRLAGRQPALHARSSPTSHLERLRDQPGGHRACPPLTRLGCKMATGSGKTVVMAMLWPGPSATAARCPATSAFPRGAGRLPQPDHQGAPAGPAPGERRTTTMPRSTWSQRPCARCCKGQGAGHQLAPVRAGVGARRGRQIVHGGEQGAGKPRGVRPPRPGRPVRPRRRSWC